MKNKILFILVSMASSYLFSGTTVETTLVSHFLDNSSIVAKEGIISQVTFANHAQSIDMLREDQVQQLSFPVLEHNISFTRDYVQSHGDIKTWRGKNASNGATILLTLGKDHFFGHILFKGHQFIFEPGQDYGITVFSEVDSSFNIPSVSCQAIPDYDKVNKLLAEEKPVQRSLKSAPADGGCEPGTVIDVMIIYTKGFAELRGDGTAARIQNYLDVANESYINSQINTQLNLAHSYEVDYPDYTPDPGGNPDVGSITIALYDITYKQGNYNPGIFDNIEALRDKYGIDQVTLINKVTPDEMGSGGITCGLAWLIKTSIVPSGSRVSYAVIEDGTICGSSITTYAHEVGHNMGCAHDRNTGGGAGKHSYSYGYQDSPNQFVTVMAYDWTCPGNCEYVNHFSNPEVNYEGAPTGILHTDPEAADNARTINETRNIMGQYRDVVRGTTLDYYYVIPEVMYGEGLTTTLHIANTTATGAAAVELYGFTAEGVLLNEGGVSLSLPSRGQKSMDFASKFGPLSSQVDWIQVGASRPLHVFAEFTSNKVSSAFWASDKTGYSAYVPHVAKNTEQFETVIATANSTGKIAAIELSPEPFGDAQSMTNASCSYGKSSGTAVEYFGYDVELVDWAEIKSTNKTVAAMEYFSYLPEKEKIASLGLNNQTTNTLRFLHVATDTANFWTGLVYINVSSGSIPVIEHFYAADGSEIYSEARTLIRGEKRVFIFDRDNIEPEGTAWIEIETETAALVGYELFGSANGSPHQFFAGFQGATTTGSKLDYPITVSDDQKWTGLVALNLGDITGNITFRAINSSGTILESITIEDVGPNVKIVKTADMLFSPATLNDIAWVQAYTSASEWNGFVIWGDKTETRHLLSGLSASVHD